MSAWYEPTEAKDSKPTPSYSIEGWRYRAEISGAKDGSVYRVWQSEQTYPNAREALAAAKAHAEGK